jgi:DinB superfamily
MTSLSSSLASLRDELEGTTARLHALVDTMDDAVWRTRPGEKRWSVAECIEHLNITSRAYFPLLKNALRDGRARGLTNPSSSNRLDVFGWLLAKSLGPPVKERRRLRTPEAFVPHSIEPKAKVVGEYEEMQHALIALLVDAEGLAISKIKVASPFAKIHYSVYSAFRIIATHQRRHLWQAERAREAVRAVAR